MSKSSKKSTPIVSGEQAPVVYGEKLVASGALAAAAVPNRSVVAALAQTSPWAGVVFYAIQAGWSPEQVNYLIITLLPLIALHTILGRSR